MVKPGRTGQQDNAALSALRGMDWNLMGSSYLAWKPFVAENSLLQKSTG